MHELSLCNALLCQLERISLENGSSRVAKVIVGIGPLSGVEPDLLHRAYPIAAAGSVAEDAELVIESEGVVVTCSQCGQESSVSANRLVCMHCGDFRTNVISGDELILRRVELESQPLQADGAN